VTYPQGENGVRLSASGKRLLLANGGDGKSILQRPLEGTPKTVTIRRMATGKWFVTITCEWEEIAHMPTESRG
jgi:putative transposase